MLSKWVELKEEADETHGNERLTYFSSKQYGQLTPLRTGCNQTPKYNSITTLALFAFSYIGFIGSSSIYDKSGYNLILFVEVFNLQAKEF